MRQMSLSFQCTVCTQETKLVCSIFSLPFCTQKCHNEYKEKNYATALELPIGIYGKGANEIRVTIARSGDKENILHINGVAMMTKHFYVTYSTIAEAGWGLFARKKIRKSNDHILRYNGSLIKQNDPNLEQIINRGYMIELSPSTLKMERKESRNPVIGIEAYPYVSEGALKRIGGFANEATGDKINTITVEETYLDDDNYQEGAKKYFKIYMVAIKKIPVDSEIFWNYGSKYKQKYQ